MNEPTPENVETPCDSCEGRGYLGHESWHTWDCSDCGNTGIARTPENVDSPGGQQ